MANKNYLKIVIVSVLIVLAIVIASSYFAYQNKWEIFVKGNATTDKVNTYTNNQNNNVNTNTNTNTNNNVDDSFKTCSSGKVWGCKPITQGEYTGVPAPSVCGCVPTCASGLHLVTSGTGVNDKWPDGSRKGTFECSKELPP